jgi:hypothetical protein
MVNPLQILRALVTDCDEIGGVSVWGTVRLILIRVQTWCISPKPTSLRRGTLARSPSPAGLPKTKQGINTDQVTDK